MADQTEVAVVMSADVSLTAAGNKDAKDKVNKNLNDEIDGKMEAKATDMINGEIDYKATDKISGEIDGKATDKIDAKASDKVDGEIDDKTSEETDDKAADKSDKANDTTDDKTDDKTDNKTDNKTDDKLEDGVQNKGMVTTIKAGVHSALIVARKSVGFAAKIFRREPRKPFPFERLPLNVRNQIYRLMMRGDATLRSRTGNSQLNPGGRVLPPKLGKYAIGNVSLKIRTEFYKELALQHKFYINGDNAIEIAQCLDKLPYALHASLKHLDIMIHSDEDITSQICVLTGLVLRMRHLDELTINVPRVWFRLCELELRQRFRYLLTSGKVTQLHVSTTVGSAEMFETVGLHHILDRFRGGVHNNPRVLVLFMTLTFKDGVINVVYR